MRVQTNAGEVELTAEMVRRGMVFEVGGQYPTRATVHAPVSAWEATIGFVEYDVRRMLARPDCAFLGCDPTVAAREDCERFGIAPGIDVGAHGFARLRDGGAVDLRREGLPMGAVVLDTEFNERGTPIDCDGPWRTHPLEKERLVGLHAGYARPEDVERLCCGERDTADRQDERGAWQAATWRRCTLAIGDHTEHEDIATGTRWPAKESVSAGTGFLFENDGGRLRPAESGHDLRDMFTFHRAVAPSTPIAGHSVVFNAQADQWVNLASIASPMGGDVTFSCACGSTDPAEHRSGCELPWQYRMSATWAMHYTNARGEGLARATAEGLLGAVAVAMLAWCLSVEGYRERARRAAEAPLVALVNAVPAGIDPRGWGPAVLAYHESVSRLPERERPHPEDWGHRLAAVLRLGLHSASKGTWTAVALDRGLAAYAHAVAPQGPRPQPFRRRAPGLPVDDGRDE